MTTQYPLFGSHTVFAKHLNPALSHLGMQTPLPTEVGLASHTYEVRQLDWPCRGARQLARHSIVPPSEPPVFTHWAPSLHELAPRHEAVQ